MSQHIKNELFRRRYSVVGNHTGRPEPALYFGGIVLDFNPWHNLPHDTYEKHMGHDDVRQLQTLSLIFKEQLELVADLPKPIIAILGITGGNGLENVVQGRYKRIIGIDINAEYLNICRERYGYLPELELYRIDLMTDKDRAVEVLSDTDMVSANLVVRHIHLDNFMDIAGRLKKPIISVTIQLDFGGQAVSHSGYEAAFAEIGLIRQECGEDDLTAAMHDAGYSQFGRAEYNMPNGKMLLRLDYKR